MKISRNAPCPCGSGQKYKRCCATEAVSHPIQIPSSSRYRFEAGSYGGAGRGYMPSVLCYKQTTGDQWHEHFCLANTTLCYDDEIEATSKAESDLNKALGIKASGGSEIDLAMTLKDKGYIKIDGFQRAID